MSSRSEKDRYLPDTGASSIGGIPPACRNHRDPTGADTPHATAASSLVSPAAICTQNARSRSRRTGGRPGDRITARPVNAAAQPGGRPIESTSISEVLRPPVEPGLRIVSEMMAGWYRYVSDWRMRDDGTIGARFGFAGTRNPRTCMRHQHHVYWRFDFDINGAANDALEVQRVVIPTGGGPARLEWHPVVKEAQWKRNPAIRRRYRVVDKASGSGYQIRPSSMDGTADNHGVADMWVLRYNGQEIDDGVSIVGGQVPSAQTQAQISRFVSGDPVDGQDIVVWYAGHFLHDERHSDPSQGHIFGPDLVPHRW